MDNFNMHRIFVSQLIKRIDFNTRKYSGKKEAKKTKKDVEPRRIFKVYRYGGILSKEQPKLQNYELDVSTCGKMVLDALIKLKDMDPSLTFRKSCREGICGSCAINLQGRNCLSCITEIPPDKKITIYPLPHMYVIRDLVVDMTHFFKGYNSIRPYLVRKNPIPMGSGQYAQSVADSDMMVGLYECVLCSCCATACPSYWWNGRRFLGPASLLHAYRWVIDSRDDDTEQRLFDLRDDFKAFRCHTIMNCTLDCPKGLHPAMAIAKLKRLISGLDKKPSPEIDPMKFGSAGSLEQCIKKHS
ncbi:succinate dehydrogenase iron-sulfur subunit [Manduca sexta]|uniref:succinate dehydrogenase iron-sulfur subunit n=1 Tax=Manduca sexta TaxID=7130 RepID=UPI00188EC788|nr:succinate dehydrogenase iron-sulfur subunit [Manduca sexta]